MVPAATSMPVVATRAAPAPRLSVPREPKSKRPPTSNLPPAPTDSDVPSRPIASVKTPDEPGREIWTSNRSREPALLS